MTLALALTHTAKPQPFNGLYYATCATVIPVLCFRPKMTISTTTAALYRRLAKAGERPLTILFDETDAMFNPRTAPQYEDLRAVLNAGYKRGATVDRCVGDGASMDVAEFPVFARS